MKIFAEGQAKRHATGSPSGERRLVLSSDGVSQESPTTTDRFEWKDVIRVDTCTKYVLIYTNAGFVMLPKSAFESDAILQSAIATIERHAAAAKEDVARRAGG